jgi:hypothetical protein
MTTINTDYILPQNQRLARIINDLGELLQREDLKFYEQLILENFESKKLEPEEEKKFLCKLYISIIDKFKELKFE